MNKRCANQKCDQNVDKVGQNGRKVAYPQPLPKRRGEYKSFPLGEDLGEASPAKEETGDADEVHQPSNQKASTDTECEGDNQEK